MNNYRIRKLKKHLLKLEELTGRELRDSPRHTNLANCPVELFAPDQDANGVPFYGAGQSGNVYYDAGGEGGIINYKIYSEVDSIWWQGVFFPEREKVNKLILNWIRKRKGG